MNLSKKIKIVSTVFFLSLLIGFSYLLLQNKKTTTPQNVTPQPSAEFSVVPHGNSLLITDDAPTMGPNDAPVTIVEFLDPECEACSAMNPIVKRIMKEHEGKIKLVIRYMPFHQNSKFAANVLEGAKKEGQFWQALNLMFEEQNTWASHHDPKPELIFEVIKPLKLNLSKIKSDAEQGIYNSIIEKDFQDGKKLGVNKTPTFFVNGNELYEIGYEPLKQAVMNYLK